MEKLPLYRLEISMESISCGVWYTKTADHHHAMEPPLVTEYQCSWVVLSFRNRYRWSLPRCPAQRLQSSELVPYPFLLLLEFLRR